MTSSSCSNFTNRECYTVVQVFMCICVFQRTNNGIVITQLEIALSFFRQWNRVRRIFFTLPCFELLSSISTAESDHTYKKTCSTIWSKCFIYNEAYCKVSSLSITSFNKVRFIRTTSYFYYSRRLIRLITRSDIKRFRFWISIKPALTYNWFLTYFSVSNIRTISKDIWFNIIDNSVLSIYNAIYVSSIGLRY